MKRAASWRVLIILVVFVVTAGATFGVLHQRSHASGSPAMLLLATPLPVTVGAAPTPAEVEQAWSRAAPLNVHLAGGIAASIQIRAVYSATAVYFQLHWPDNGHDLAGPAVQQQRATVTWRRAEALGGCAVVCHVSFSSGRRIDSMQVVAPDVTASPFTVLLDQWNDGWWTLGYARPLVTSDVEDIQFTDLRRGYTFGLDVVAGQSSAHTMGEALTMQFAAG